MNLIIICLISLLLVGCTANSSGFAVQKTRSDPICNSCETYDDGICNPIIDQFGLPTTYCADDLCCASDSECSDGWPAASEKCNEGYPTGIVHTVEHLIDNDLEFNDGIKRLYSAIAVDSGDAYDQSHCESDDTCENKILVVCMPQVQFCTRHPGSSGACTAPCKIIMPMDSCVDLGFIKNLSDQEIAVETFADKMLAKTTYPDDYEAIKSICVAKHEMIHAQDQSKDCPDSGTEKRSYDESKRCYDSAISQKCPDKLSAKDCAYLELGASVSGYNAEYMQCLYDNKAPDKRDRYILGACDRCKEELEADYWKIVIAGVDFDPVEHANKLDALYCRNREVA